VALAAIQALYRRLQEKENCCDSLQSELIALKQENAKLKAQQEKQEARLAAIESQLAK
jgi:hypothetical protein